MQTSLDELKSRLKTIEDRPNEPEKRSVQIIQSEEHRLLSNSLTYV